jgi:putative acetyltransferase
MMNETTKLQAGVFPVQPDDYPRVVEVWESSVRATHHFVAESDIQIFKPMVRDVLQHLNLVCVRDTDGEVVGFTAVTDGNVDMLFIHADWRGQGVGGRLLRHAIESMGARALDVNEQNAQALGFYIRMGFEVVGRSELDGTGKPYPLLHMRLATKEPG